MRVVESKPLLSIDRGSQAPTGWRSAALRLPLYSILPVVLLSGILATPARAQGVVPLEIDGGDIVRALPGLRHVLALLEANEIVGRVLALQGGSNRAESSRANAAGATPRMLPRLGVVGAQDALSFRQSYGVPRRARPQLPAVSIGTKEIPMRRGNVHAKMVFSLHQEIQDADIPKVRPLVVGGFEYRF